MDFTEINCRGKRGELLGRIDRQSSRFRTAKTTIMKFGLHASFVELESAKGALNERSTLSKTCSEKKTSTFNTEWLHMRYWVNHNTLKTLEVARTLERSIQPCYKAIIGQWTTDLLILNHDQDFTFPTVLKETYGDAAMDRYGVFEWHKLFRDGKVKGGGRRPLRNPFDQQDQPKRVWREQFAEHIL
ncbi:hypothetical protein TNCV_3254081 [Trichonephila clavipes]|nr:hypothetical protein TNCV_3254081 [Trichonephila clavipes]